MLILCVTLKINTGGGFAHLGFGVGRVAGLMASKTPYSGRKSNVSESTRTKNIRNQQAAIISGVRHVVNPTHGVISTEHYEKRVAEKTTEKRKAGGADLSRIRTTKRGKLIQKSVFSSGSDAKLEVTTPLREPYVRQNMIRERVQGIEVIEFLRYIVSSDRDDKEESEGVVTRELDECSKSSSPRGSSEERKVLRCLERVPVDVAFYNVVIGGDEIREWAFDKTKHKTELSKVVSAIIRLETNDHIKVLGIDCNCIRSGMGLGKAGLISALELCLKTFPHEMPVELLALSKKGTLGDHREVIPIWALYPLFCSLPQSILEVNDVHKMCVELYSDLKLKSPRDVGWNVERVSQAIDILGISIGENTEYFMEMASQNIISKEELVNQMTTLRARQEATEAYVKTMRCQTSIEVSRLSKKMDDWSKTMDTWGKRIETVEETLALMGKHVGFG